FKLKSGFTIVHNYYSERNLGSIASRMASPSKFNANTVSKMAKLGYTANHHASIIFSKPSLIMLPKVEAGGRTPKPIKLNDASVRMAEAVQSEANTTTSEIIFGKTCTPMILSGL